MEPRSYLLTGGSGRLGTALQDCIGLIDQCWAPTSKELDIVNFDPYTFYQENKNSLSRVGTIIHCAAYTNVPKAEVERDACIDANVIGTKNIAMLGTMLGVRVIYISTDYVYPGIDGNYREDSKPEPFNFYGFTKYCGEAYMYPEKDLIVRTSFKPSEWPYPKAFDDLYCSADYVDVIADKIAFLTVQTWEPGIINVGTERKSIYELARRRNVGVSPMSRNEIKDVKMPIDISMDTTKFDTIYRNITED